MQYCESNVINFYKDKQTMAGTINLIMVVWIIQNSILGAVAQAKLTISPAEVVLTSSSPLLTTFTCAFESGVSVQDVYTIQILRQRETDSSETALAELKGSVGTAAFVLNAPADVQNRANVSGQIETTKRDSRVVLTFNTSDIECSDRGHYFCSVSYQDTSSINQNGITNQTLQLYALPVNGTLSATKNNLNLAGGTFTNQADVNVGETVQFTCSGKIGSVNTTTVRWRRTSEIGTVDNLIIYNPSVGFFSNGNPSFVSNECTYSRAATMTYNVSSADANRDNNLAFQCYVSVAPPNGQGTYEVQSEIFYINANEKESGASTIVAQAKMTISPSEVGLTSSSPPFTTFTCAFKPGVVVQDVYNMLILRQRETDNSQTALAELKGSIGTAAFVPNAPADVVNRANVSGQIEATKRDSELVLTFRTADIQGSDRGHYFCSVFYRDTNFIYQNGVAIQKLHVHDDQESEASTIGSLVQVMVIVGLLIAREIAE